MTPTIAPTAVFDTYWRFAAERQRIYYERMTGEPPPWTDDSVLQQHRFTNCYRASDRVSQYLIKHVIYSADGFTTEDHIFRILLFKLFNKIATWEILYEAHGDIRWEMRPITYLINVLEAACAHGFKPYNGAYVMPPVDMGSEHKFVNHLLLLEAMMLAGLPRQITWATSLKDVFTILRSYPGIGDFLAYQFTIDINYSPVIDFSENDFVVPGPGAISGIRKCFGLVPKTGYADVIRYMVDYQEDNFDRLDLAFYRLGGHRPLHLIDCQNLFCEVDKYARIMHPEFVGVGNRKRIKQNYRPLPTPLETPFFPPKWGLNNA